MIKYVDSNTFWDFADNGDAKEDPIHRIHGYPAKFPAFITAKALQYARDRRVDVTTIADVFCGCGTTAVEARKKGMSFWGCDINPVATLIAQVKTSRYHDATLARYYAKVKDSFETESAIDEDYRLINDRIRYWFEDENIDDLLRLLKAIRLQIPRNSLYRKYFLCAFSNILKPTSRWLTKSIKAQRDPNKVRHDVMEAFNSQYELMRRAIKGSIGISAPNKNNTITISTRDFLSNRPIKRIADLIVTSPPYVVSYDYADIHQLSALWLGFATDYRDLRKNMIGNRYGVSPPSETDIDQLCRTGKQTFSDLLLVDRGKAASVIRYFMDLGKTADRCWHLLNESGLAVFVIGNTQYGGVKIDNAGYLAECMERTEFKDVEITRRKVSLKIMTPYRDSKGRFTRDSTERQVYNEEFVVTGRRQ